MARIRTIKPEFWTSEQIVECSTNARLLFIGLWSFSDDGGVHPANPMRLKMEVFPGDAFTKDQIQEMIDELLGAGLIKEYEVDGELFWAVTGWKHQKIDQPTYKYPQPSGQVPETPSRRRASGDRSEDVRRTLDECSPQEGNVKEGKGEEHTSSGDKRPPAEASYKTKKGRQLKGSKLAMFEQFWEAFDYKSGRAEAADAWLDLQDVTLEMFEQIIAGAKREAARRSDLIASGRTPKMAQGWLSGRRWEDSDVAAHTQPHSSPSSTERNIVAVTPFPRRRRA